MTQPESRTVEERLLAALKTDGVRGHHFKSTTEPWDGGYRMHSSEEMIGPLLVAAKEHGLVIGEGELDAAWKEAEAALPEGWRMYRLVLVRKDDVSAVEDRAVFDAGMIWSARAIGPHYDDWLGNKPWAGDDMPAIQVLGSTPAAALRALAERLRR